MTTTHAQIKGRRVLFYSLNAPVQAAPLGARLQLMVSLFFAYQLPYAFSSFLSSFKKRQFAPWTMRSEIVA